MVCEAVQKLLEVVFWVHGYALAICTQVFAVLRVSWCRMYGVVLVSMKVVHRNRLGKRWANHPAELF